MALSFQTSHMVVCALLGTSVQSAVTVHMRIPVRMVPTATGLALKERMSVSHVTLEGLAQGKV